MVTLLIYLSVALVVLAAVLLLVFLRPAQEEPAAPSEEDSSLITQPYAAGATVEQPTPYYAAPVPESPDPLEVAANLDRKALLATGLLFGVFAMLGAYFAFSTGSSGLLATATERQLKEAIGELPREGDPASRRGAYLFSTLCFDCHGKRGQGLVGLPLNKPDFRASCLPDGKPVGADRPCKPGTQPGIPQGPDDQKVWDLIFKTVSRGRQRLPPSISMPAWAREEGGPLNSEQIRQVVTFIMYGNWDLPLQIREEEANELRKKAEQESDPQKKEDLLKQASERVVEHPPTPAVKATPEELGKTVAQQTCAVCHSFEKGKNSPNPAAPNLGAYASEGPFAEQVKALKASDPEWLRKWVTNAPAIKPGTGMPKWEGVITAEQIDAVVAYLKTLK